MYDSLNNPNRQYKGDDAALWGKPARPDDFGYRGAAMAPEHMAEAIRAYLADPNYLKAAAPKTAARIREYVNTHPLLAQIIQFNAMAGLAVPALQPWRTVPEQHAAPGAAADEG